MQLVSHKCPQCLGDVVPVGGGYGKCAYCGAVYQIGETTGDVPAGLGSEEPRARFDPKAFFEDWITGGDASKCVETYFGSSLPGKREDAARRYFNVPAGEPMYLANDTTIFGSGKKGFACCKTGIYLNDEDNSKRHIPWDKFKDCRLSVEGNAGGKLLIDRNGFITQDKVILRDMLEDIQKQL